MMNLGTIRARFVRTVSICFGDRVGILLFTGALLFFALTWRLEPIINDTYTILDTLLSVSEGTLYISDFVWSAKTGAPGLHAVDNRLYGRNYGQIFIALPFYVLLKSIAPVVSVRILLVGGWSVLLVVFADQLGAELGSRSLYGSLGSGIGLVLFVVNVEFATSLNSSLLSLIAMQLSTMVAAALVGVLLYRLIDQAYDRRTGVAAALAVLLATPIGFWAAFPKRHSLTALATMLVLISLYRSRAADDPAEKLRYRALCYVWIGLFAWVHAPEAFLLMVGVGLVDVLTAESTDIRDVVLVGSAFTIALLPFLVTNYLISGNPVAPPRTLPSPGGTWSLIDGVVVTHGDSAPPDPSDVSVGGEPSTGIVSTVTNVILVFLRHVMTSLSQMGDPVKFYHTFIRSGYVESVATLDRNIAMRLSMLESMPLLGGLAVIPLLVHRRYDRALLRTVRRNPLFATDLLAFVLALLFLVTYWPRLPIHASMTVRYLHPLYLLGVYGLVRVPAVRVIIARQSRLLVWSYTTFVLVGGQLLVVVLAILEPTIGEAVQLHAQIALFASALLGVWVLLATDDPKYEKPGAIILGLAAAVATLYLLLSGLIYFSFTANYGLPISRLIADALRVLEGPVTFSR